ncbi:MAG: hypothetical protein MI922_14150, partial [Bacteroidales bacterium]|nr:hypothetical protein [Bacteroidales bacterium]
MFSCEKTKDDAQKFETYFDSEDFVKDGLIAYYPFNGDVKDYSDHELDGTPNNVTYSTDRFGNPNGACKFSGDNSYVKIINDKLLNQGEYTICFWYRADTINDGNNRVILSKSDTIEGYAIYTTRESNLLTHGFQETRMFNGDIGYSGNTILGSSPNYWSA